MKLKSREKILLVFACIAISFLVLDRLYYFQRSRKILALREEVKSAEAQIKELNLYSQGLEEAQREIERLERELKTMSGKVLRGEEFKVFLKHLARESDSPQMKMISITPFEEKSQSPDEKKEKASPSYRTINVEIIFQSTFAKLVSYLKGIEEIPFLIQLQNLQIERQENAHPLLKVKMTLKIPVTEKEKE